MFKLIIFSCSLAFCAISSAKNNESELALFGQLYFDSWVATQAPNASNDDIEKYLSLLTDDVGHQHLPYDLDDSREANGKKDMRTGMQYYLGGHTEHSAKLISMTLGLNVVVLKYHTVSKGVHPQTKQAVSFSYDTTEVLEIEGERVSVIRKYSE